MKNNKNGNNKTIIIIIMEKTHYFCFLFSPRLFILNFLLHDRVQFMGLKTICDSFLGTLWWYSAFTVVAAVYCVLAGTEKFARFKNIYNIHRYICTYVTRKTFIRMNSGPDFNEPYDSFHF